VRSRLGSALLLVITIAACADAPPGPQTVDASSDLPPFVGAGCEELELDQRYRCGYHAVEVEDDLIFTKVLSDGRRALYASRVEGGARQERRVVDVPPGWTLNATSIAPDREHFMVNMLRPSCSTQWPDAAGESCSWGRPTLWLVSHRGDTWEWESLTSLLGKNSSGVGWAAWLSKTRVLFNAKSRPAGVPLVESQDGQDVPAYLLDLEGPTLRIWGGAAGISNEHCFVGRMHASGPARGDACFDGQRVALTRRCDDEPIGPELWAWFNQRSDAGDAGRCVESQGPPVLVPAFRVYVVELDASCEPRAFDRDKPIRAPDWQGHWRHMGTAREWGDGQSTISADGRHVAFWSQRGFSFNSPTDNCEAFASEEGTLRNGAPRVRYCELDENLRCVATLNLPEPADPRYEQGNAYFHRLSAPGDVRLIDTEGPDALMTLTATGERVTVIQNGGGGHPVAP
jgi:hypothetical protein